MKTKKLLIALLMITILGFFNVAVSTNITAEKESLEEELVLEDWMKEVFISEDMFIEEPLEVEDWMTEPFKIN